MIEIAPPPPPTYCFFPKMRKSQSTRNLQKYLCIVGLGSFTVHLPIFFRVGLRCDGHYGPEMGGMDPKPRPTKPRDFLTYHYFLNGKFKITLKVVFKNYVLNHFLYWKESESCSSTDVRFHTYPRNIFPPQNPRNMFPTPKLLARISGSN